MIGKLQRLVAAYWQAILAGDIARILELTRAYFRVLTFRGPEAVSRRRVRKRERLASRRMRERQRLKSRRIREGQRITSRRIRERQRLKSRSIRKQQRLKSQRIKEGQRITSRRIRERKRLQSRSVREKKRLKSRHIRARQRVASPRLERRWWVLPRRSKQKRRPVKSRHGTREKLSGDLLPKTQRQTILEAIAAFPILLDVHRATYSNPTEPGARVFRKISLLSDQEREVLEEDELTEAREIGDYNVTKFVDLIQSYLDWYHGRLPTLLDNISRRDRMLADLYTDDAFLNELKRPLLMLLPLTVEELDYVWNGSSVSDIPLRDSGDKKSVCFLLEGQIAPELMAQIISRDYSDVTRIDFAFLTRPGDVIQTYQRFFADDQRVGFPDLLIDYTGNYSPRIKPVSGLARWLGDRAFTLLEEQESDERITTRMDFYRDALAMSADDTYYRYLRMHCGLESFLTTERFDHIALVSAYSTYLLESIAAIRQHSASAECTIAMISKSPAVQLRVRNKAMEALSFQMHAEDAGEHDQGNFISPYADYASGLGFVHTLIGTLGNLSEDTLQKARRNEGERMRMAKFRLREIGNDRMRVVMDAVAEHGKFFGTDAHKAFTDLNGAICIAANMNDRLYRPVAVDLILHYARLGRKVLFYNLTNLGSEHTRELLENLPETTRMAVINYRHLQQNDDLKLDLQERADALTGEALMDGLDTQTALQLDRNLLASCLELPTYLLHRNITSGHISHAIFTEALFSAFGIQKLVIFPTRNTYFRITAQAARLLDIPSIEMQVVLAGKMVRHRSPSTSQIAALGTWSGRLFSRHMNYPLERVKYCGSQRYVDLIEKVSESYPDETLPAMKRELLDESGASRLLVFGTQPMQMTDTLNCLDVICEAAAELSELFVAVKLHPQEPDANIQTYQRILDRHGLTKRSLVTKTDDVYRLIMLSDVTVSQTSNILIEAGILRRSAVALNLGDYEPPVDFEEMGVAPMLYDNDEVLPLLRDILEDGPKSRKMRERLEDFHANNPHLRDLDYKSRLYAAIDALPTRADREVDPAYAYMPYPRHFEQVSEAREMILRRTIEASSSRPVSIRSLARRLVAQSSDA